MYRVFYFLSVFGKCFFCLCLYLFSPVLFVSIFCKCCFSDFFRNLVLLYQQIINSSRLHTLKRVVNHPLSYTFFFYFRVYWSELLPLQKYYIISFHSNDAAITKKCAFQRNDGLSHAHDKTKIIFLQLPCSIRKMLPSFQFLVQFNFHSFFYSNSYFWFSGWLMFKNYS